MAAFSFSPSICSLSFPSQATTCFLSLTCVQRRCRRAREARCRRSERLDGAESSPRKLVGRRQANSRRRRGKSRCGRGEPRASRFGAGRGAGTHGWLKRERKQCAYWTKKRIDGGLKGRTSEAMSCFSECFFLFSGLAFQQSELFHYNVKQRWKKNFFFYLAILRGELCPCLLAQAHC